VGRVRFRVLDSLLMKPRRGEHLPADAGARVARIAIPVSLEFMLVLGLTFVNQIVVGGLGEVAVAAVGFANAINTIPLFFFGAINIGAGVVVARAFGGTQRALVNKSVTFAVVVAVVTGLLAAIPFVLFPQEILRFSGASEAVIAAGSEYLAVLVAGLAAGVLGMVLGGVLRSSNRPRSPMVATLITVALNTPLAIVLVYGLGPIEGMGVVGAAWATLITSVVKVIILLTQTFLVFDVANWVFPTSRREWISIGKPILVLAFPMALTSISWTLGNFFYNVIVQQLGDGPLAAVNIVMTMSSVFIVGSIGFGSTITVLVGQAIGSGNGALAKDWVDYVLRLGIATSVIFGILFALASLSLPMLFPRVDSSVLTIATLGIMIAAVFQPFSVRMLLYASVLPSGNDTTGIIIGDFAGPYLVGLPFALLLAFATPLGPLGAIVAKGAEDTVKLAIFAWRGRRIRWEAVQKLHEDSLIPFGDTRTGPISII
jgi:putative MATE family efflux protein